MRSFDLQEEVQALQDVFSYDIPNESDVSSMDSRSITSLLETAVESLAESADAIVEDDVFDAYRSLLKYADHLQGTTMTKLLDSISSGFQTQVELTIRDVEHEDPQTFMAHKTPLEMYAFLLNWFVISAEKVKTSGEVDAPASTAKPKRGRGKAIRSRATSGAERKKADQNWTWEDQIPSTLALIGRVLRLKIQRIWTTTAEKEAFIGCMTRPVYRITENEQYMKNQTVKMGVYKVICLAVKHHGHGLAAQIHIMQSLQYSEYLSEPMAECLTILAKEFDHPQLGDEVLREIAGKSFGAQDSTTAFSRFLVKLAELSPRSILKQISLLLSHMDSEAYQMRMALVEIVGCLIRELAISSSADATNPNNTLLSGADATSNPTTPEQIQRQLTGLYSLLLERCLDLNAFVRTKVLTTLTKLLDLPVKFPKQRLKITRAAIECLEDKTASVRKSAVVLIVKLILTHPYGLMHGGLLGQKEWEGRYKEVEEELKKVEDVVGKVVERSGETEEDEAEGEDGGEEGTDAEEEGEEEEGEGPSTPKKRSKRKGQDSMDVDESQDEEEQDEQPMDEDGQPRSPKKKRSRKSELDMEALTNEQAALAALESDQLLHLRLRKRYYAEGLNFIRQVEDGMAKVEPLLASQNKAEVLEAMEFFRVAHEYQFDGAEAGIKKMLHLIWHKDNSSTSEDGKELKGIRSRLMECYRNLYFDAIPDMEPKQQVNRIAKNMIELTYDATLAELTSLEEMMRIMMDEGLIHPDVISKLWQVYSSERPLPRAQRRGAVIIIGMLALARRAIVSEKVDTLVKIGLGNLGKHDLMLARYTCLALQRLNGSAKKVKGSLLDHTVRLETENPIFRKLVDTIERPCRSKEWFGMAEQALNAIYALCERPDILCDSIIKNFTRRAFGKSQQTQSQTQSTGGTPSQRRKSGVRDPDAMDEDEEKEEEAEEKVNSPDPNATQETIAGESGGDTGDAFELSQLVFIVGHVAIKHIVFLELVERELKRQKNEKDLAEKAEKTKNSRNESRAAKEAEDIEQVAGNAEDDINDRISGMRETELLFGTESLLAIYGPMVVHICGSPHKFKNRTLRAAATLAFSKFLCVSSSFCDQHHRLLFKILETSKDPSIRSNAVIALGDVAVSFSSIIDENSNELYKGLSDTDLVVKKNTLMVLTHLILNGMIKVKGQLGEMAKCLEDPEERISDLAKLFFKELSTKENAIYNNLPDVISHLSVGAHAVDEAVFQSTMKYIFTFIEKEKQAENIVEKLCQRFRLSEDPRQWRDIAFCLSLLPFKSERSVKKLIEGLQFYRDKLHEQDVFSRFQEILTKARSNKSSNKPDQELNEFEAILEDHRRQGEEDQALEKRVEGKKAAAKKKATRKSARKRAPQRTEDDDEDME